MENNSGRFPDGSHIKTADYVFTDKELLYKKLLIKYI